MKTGDRPPRLSARLAANMAQMREDQHASMRTSLASFSADFQTMLSGALDTMSGDIQRFTETASGTISTTQSDLRRRLSWMSRTSFLSPLSLAGALAMIFALSWAFAWAISAFRNPLAAWGLSEVTSGKDRFLIQSPGKTEVLTCTIGGQTFLCFKLKE